MRRGGGAVGSDGRAQPRPRPAVVERGQHARIPFTDQWGVIDRLVEPSGLFIIDQGRHRPFPPRLAERRRTARWADSPWPVVVVV